MAKNSTDTINHEALQNAMKDILSELKQVKEQVKILTEKLEVKTGPQPKENLRMDEAMKYLGLGRTRFLYKLNYYGYTKSESGYYSKKDLDNVAQGIPSEIFSR